MLPVGEARARVSGMRAGGSAATVLELLFPGDSEMARRMRAHDWDGSALGDPAGWPASLRTACRICLTSRFPMIVWWGPELSFLYNDAYLPLLGSKHPALGKPGEQVWAEIWPIIGPMLDSVLSTGQATWSEDLLLPMNRHGYWEETYWTYSYSPLHDDAGTVRGVFTAVSETTERVIGERRLTVLHDLGARAGHARSVAEACELVAAALGRAGADVPLAAVYLRDDATGELVLAASSPLGAQPAPRTGGPGGWPLDEAIALGQPVRVTDVRARFGDLPAGGWSASPAQAVVLPLAFETGGPAGVLVAAASAGRALDEAYESFLTLVGQQTAALVTGAVAYQAQQRRAEELAELDRAKTVFFSNVSHEFRTPLSLITGPLEELRAALPDPGAAVARELDVIDRNAQRLSKLVNTLLDFSRLEAGRMQPRFEAADLAALTAELASSFRSAMDRAGLAFEVDCPPLPEPVYVDPELWEKVVLNLLSNALKFTFQGSVRVGVRVSGDQAVTEVADTGTGIPAAELPRLFERFHRVATARARSHEGSGIGLALAAELVALHGGEITAASTEGAGTVFTVTLPLGRSPGRVAAGPAPARGLGATRAYVQEAERWLPGGESAWPVDAGEPAGPAGPAGPAARDGARVLLADDNADMREYLQRLLDPEYQVQAVADGQAALDQARARPPDLVISDVMMPGRDGLSLVVALRADPVTAGVPVMLLSARAGQESVIEGLDAGADEYLVKPFAAAELRARVRGILRLAQVRGAHARWRTAMIDSMQEAFFVADQSGAIVEVNSAFTRLLGYGPGDLPYTPAQPWPPHLSTEPARPARHRDGRLVWIAASISQATDPQTGQRMTVGTLRDVTAEHYVGQRQTAVAAMGVLLSEAETVPEAVTGTIWEIREIWHARQVLAVTWDDTGEPALAAAGPARAWDDLPEAARDAISALRAGPRLRPATSGPGAVGIALEHPGGLLALWAELDPDRPFASEDEALLTQLCGYLVQALHRIHQSGQQREAALALQRAILGPAELPPGFAARYEPATRPLEVGGDWYDIIDLPDGRTGLVVGDCVGHGLAAATVMGQVRSAGRALLLRETSPARALAALDQFAAQIPGAACSTVFCGILDPATGRLVYSSAGHPPAIVAAADGGITLLEDGRSASLAVAEDLARSDAECVLPGRSTLLLYTDGLVERRRQPLDEGIMRAAAAVQAGRSALAADLAGQLMAGLAPAGGYEDDAALLLYRHPVPLELTFPADAAQLAPARRALRHWLTQCGLATRTIQDVLVAAGEACANAVEHGARHGASAPVRLAATATATDLRLTVTDGGQWREPAPGATAYRGHGIPFMRAVMTRVAIAPGQNGTVVNMELRISS
jgi:signal transduction histidine kinase/CheY-like chemotaxis protein/anti-sigma regulatory factor (Ser/Thr protein kinase)